MVWIAVGVMAAPKISECYSYSTIPEKWVVAVTDQSYSF